MYERFGGLSGCAGPVGEQEVRQEGPQEQVPQAQGQAQLSGDVRPVLMVENLGRGALALRWYFCVC